MNKIFITILCFIMLSISTNADIERYSKVLNIKVESQNFTFKHHHDWTDKNEKKLYKMITTDHSAIFKNSNNYSFIELLNNKGKRVFKKPSPAFTYLVISPDEQYFVGLSKIQVDNPYNFAVWNKSGRLVSRMHFTSGVAKLSENDFSTFKKKFPKQFQFLKKWDRITFTNNTYYLDAYFMNAPVLLGKMAWKYLYNFHSPHYISPNIGESVTNWVYYYDEKNPDVKFEYSDKNVLKSITLNDPKGERIVIPIE